MIKEKYCFMPSEEAPPEKPPAEEEKEITTLPQVTLTEVNSPLHTTQNVSISFSEFD
jgi:hypothetical protein